MNSISQNALAVTSPLPMKLGIGIEMPVDAQVLGYTGRIPNTRRSRAAHNSMGTGELGPSSDSLPQLDTSPCFTVGPMASRDVSSEVVSEDVSTVPISCSVTPSSVEYGIGSDAGRCVMGLGELLHDGFQAVLIRRRLSSIRTQLRGNCSNVGKDEKACQHLLELSR